MIPTIYKVEIGIHQMEVVIAVTDIHFIQQLLGHEKLESIAISTPPNGAKTKGLPLSTAPADVGEKIPAQQGKT